MLLATMVALLVATVLRCRREDAAWGCLVPKKAMAEHWGGASLWPPKKVLSSLAFGSCSAYDVRQQPIWEQASWAGALFSSAGGLYCLPASEPRLRLFHQRSTLPPWPPAAPSLPTPRAPRTLLPCRASSLPSQTPGSGLGTCFMLTRRVQYETVVET